MMVPHAPTPTRVSPATTTARVIRTDLFIDWPSCFNWAVTLLARMDRLFSDTPGDAALQLRASPHFLNCPFGLLRTVDPHLSGRRGIRFSRPPMLWVTRPFLWNGPGSGTFQPMRIALPFPKVPRSPIGSGRLLGDETDTQDVHHETGSVICAAPPALTPGHRHRQFAHQRQMIIDRTPDRPVRVKCSPTWTPVGCPRRCRSGRPGTIAPAAWPHASSGSGSTSTSPNRRPPT